ncbi:MAG: hypothetical protein HY800_09740 [Ignavibacteriales bacterium]|nr:hypothetical protein [Ignavibacteriales bacterium]
MNKKLIYVITVISSIFWSCENEKSGTVDLNFSTPQLISASIDQTIINLDTDTTGSVDSLGSNRYRIVVGVKIAALKGNSDIPSNGIVKLFKPKTSSAFSKYSVKIDQINSDTITYSDNISFQIQRSDVGLFSFVFSLQTTDDKKTNEIQKSLFISRRNSQPAITTILMPDSLTLGQIPSPDSSFLVGVSVADSDGIDDIENVYFYSRKPDGSIGNCGVPAELHDDGSLNVIFQPDYRSGDLVAGDGIFSLRIALRTRFKNNCPPPDSIDTQRGNYTFTFFATDKSDAISDSAVKVWKVK